MTKAMIDDTVAAFAAAAVRCQAGGLDGVELHGAHGYLIAQFLSPATNLRDDDYGGSTENRARFLVEILRAIRAEVGPDFPVGVRLSGTDFIEGGIDPVEAAAIARLVEPLIDFLDVSMSSYWRFHKFLSTMDDPLGYEIPTSEQVTKAVAVPTIVTGRIMTLDHASHLVESGVADMVSMVRAMIADPHLVVKARAGREARDPPVHRHEHGLRRPADDDRAPAVRRQRGRRQGDHGAVRDAGAGRRAEEGARRRGRPGRARGGAHGRAAGPRRPPLRDDRTSSEGRCGSPPPPRTAPTSRRSPAGWPTRWSGSASTSTCARPSTLTSCCEAEPDEVIVATGSTPRRDGFQLSTPVDPRARRRSCRTCSRAGTSSASAAGRRSARRPWCTTTPAPSRPSPPPTCSSPRGASVTVVSRMEQVGANVPYPPATVEASRERLFAARVRFVPAMALREITPDRGRRARHRQRRGRRLPGRHRRHRQLPRAERGTSPTTCAGQGFNVHLAGDVTGTATIQAAIHGASALARQL